jgi:hypothetical protein
MLATAGVPSPSHTRTGGEEATYNDLAAGFWKESCACVSILPRHTSDHLLKALVRIYNFCTVQIQFSAFINFRGMELGPE